MQSSFDPNATLCEECFRIIMWVGGNLCVIQAEVDEKESDVEIGLALSRT